MKKEERMRIELKEGQVWQTELTGGLPGKGIYKIIKLNKKSVLVEVRELWSRKGFEITLKLNRPKLINT
jgi:hypothetical protein